MLPWNTCGDTQGLVRIAPPSSTDCNFMSQLTTEPRDSRRRAPVERRGDGPITRDSQTESAAAVRCSALVRPPIVSLMHDSECKPQCRDDVEPATTNPTTQESQQR